MQKLINKYRESPTLKRAQAIRTYERAHSFSVCLLPRADSDLVAAAIYHANTGKA